MNEKSYGAGSDSVFYCRISNLAVWSRDKLISIGNNKTYAFIQRTQSAHSFHWNEKSFVAFCSCIICTTLPVRQTKLKTVGLAQVRDNSFGSMEIGLCCGETTLRSNLLCVRMSLVSCCLLHAAHKIYQWTKCERESKGICSFETSMMPLELKILMCIKRVFRKILFFLTKKSSLWYVMQSITKYFENFNYFSIFCCC